MTTGQAGVRPQAVIFDWDNTLVDTWGTIHDALNATFSALGTPLWTLEETKARTRESLRDAFPRLFGDRWEEARRIYLESFKAIHIDRLTPLPQAGELVTELAGRGLYQAVVSNKTGSLLRREAQQLDWARHFGRLVGATDAPEDKPAVAPVDLALQNSGIERGTNVWFVGDTGIDMACAVNAGCVPVLVGRTDPDATEFAANPPEFVFPDCSAIIRHFRGL